MKGEGTSLEIDLPSLHFFNGYEITVCNDNLALNAFSQKLDNEISFGWSHGEYRPGKLGWRCVAGVLGLGTLGCGIVVRASLLKKRRTIRYENDPHLGENGT